MLFTSVAIALVAVVNVGRAVASAPEQVHLALTANTGEMLVTFVITPAVSPVGTGSVTCWSAALDFNASFVASTHTYTAGGFDGTIFTATITGLVATPNVRYNYRAVVGQESSRIFDFEYNPNTDTVRFLSYGDMGVKNSIGTAKFATEHAADGFDLVVNVGDTSYADDYEAGHNAHIFDAHFNEIEGYAARMPFMACPGNHERQYNFAGYLNRMKMPVVGSGPNAPFYYSFNYGPVHFLSYSSEHDFGPDSEQGNFIQTDLAKASSPAARKERPWIIMWSHRPLYCSDLETWESRCVTEAAQYRGNIEKLMVAAKVDLHISGHNHQYERSWPVQGCSKGYTTGCVVTKTYHNAPAPVHIVNGAAGDVEGIDPSWVVDQKKVPFRALNDEGLHTGIARVVVNRTALDWTFIYTGDRAIPETNASTLKDYGKVYDHIVITKSSP